MSHLIQGSSDWLAMRKNHIGSSDAASILGVGFRTPIQVWKDKLNLAPPQADNWAMKRGRDLEPVAREAYQVYTGNFVDPDIIFHPRIKYMMASLDGLSSCKKKCVEIKVPGEKDHTLAKDGKIPEKYYPQLQHDLAILFELYEVDSMDYFSYRDGDTALVEVGLDVDFIKNLYAEEKKFWNCVETFTPPPLTDKDYELRTDPQWIEFAEERLMINKEVKALEARDEANRKAGIELCGDVNCMGNNIRMQSYLKKGSVDYKAIPELIDVDLDKYRKKEKKHWRISQY